MPTTTLDTVRLQLAATEPELRRRGIRHLAIFGSVARGEGRPDGDIDLAIEIEDGHPFSLIRLEDTLHCPVDLGEITTFRPHVRAASARDAPRIG